MTNDEVIKSVFEFLESNKEAEAVEIKESIEENVALIQVHKALSTLVNDGFIRMNERDNKKYFSLIRQAARKNSNRDTSKYSWNGVEYNKGRLALAIISDYVKKHNPTYKELCKVFPLKIIPPYGLVKPYVEAMEMSKDRARFFIKDHERIELKDGYACVSNQFTTDRIEKLIVIAATLGYEID